MSTATITSKGQITIPAEIRKALGVGAQDRLSFTLMPNGTVELRAKTKTMDDVKGILKPAKGSKVRIEDMNFG